MSKSQLPFALPVNCPQCRAEQTVTLARLQLGPLTLSCPDCGHGWRVDARVQALEFSRVLGEVPRLIELSGHTSHEERGGGLEENTRHRPD